MQHSDGDLVGINPEKMQTLIDDLKAAHQTITSFAGEFAAALSAQGISVTTVHQAGQWASDQAAKLKERLEEYRAREHKEPTGVSSPGTNSGGTTAGAGGTGTGSGAGTGAGPGGGTTGAGTGSGGGTTGAGGAGTAAGAASAGGASGGGYAGYPATPYTPAAAAGASAAHAATAQHAMVSSHAATAAKHVSHAAEHQEPLPDRVWHDIEHYACEPQFAAAFLAAIGAAGLAVLGASIAKSRKKNKEDKEAGQRQAVLDELTRSAGEYDGPPPVAWPDQAPAGTYEYQVQGELYPGHGEPYPAYEMQADRAQADVTGHASGEPIEESPKLRLVESSGS